MRFDGKNNRQRATSLTVEELSGVGTAAHDGASVTLFKTGDDVDLVKGLFQESIESRDLDDQTHEELSTLMRNHSLLGSVVGEIMHNDDNDAQTRMDQVREAVGEYIDSITMKQATEYAYNPKDGQPKLPIDTARHTAAAVAALGPGFRGQKVQLPEDARPGVIRAVRSAYRKFFPDKELPEVLKTAGPSSTEKGGHDMPDGKPNLDELQKQLQDTQQENATLKKVMALSQEHRDYYNTLDGDVAKQFLTADETTRSTQITLAKAADEEYTTMDGMVIKSSTAGAMFEVMKSQDQQLRKMRQEQALSKASKEVETDYPHLPGETAAKAKAVMALDGLAAEERETLKGMLKAVEKGAQGHFKPQGAEGAAESVAKERENALVKFNEKVAELQKSKDITKTMAIQEFSRTAEGQDLAKKINQRED